MMTEQALLNVHIKMCDEITVRGGRIDHILSLIHISFGTLYVYDFTDKFTLINNAGYLWLLFSISVI